MTFVLEDCELESRACWQYLTQFPLTCVTFLLLVWNNMLSVLR